MKRKKVLKSLEYYEVDEGEIHNEKNRYNDAPYIHFKIIDCIIRIYGKQSYVWNEDWKIIKKQWKKKKEYNSGLLQW